MEDFWGLLVGEMGESASFSAGQRVSIYNSPLQPDARGGRVQSTNKHQFLNIHTWDIKFILNNFENCFEVIELFYVLSLLDAGSSVISKKLTFVLLHSHIHNFGKKKKSRLLQSWEEITLCFHYVQRNKKGQL